MKKLLSVVLILAALFGLVAGFMDMSDALNCKTFWEQKGAESDASLAQLGDGLTTLKDNKKAYTDGLVTVAEGEESLAAGKKAFEEGLATYNAGIEEYNSKTDDYNEGMKQLQAGRGKIIAAKDKLSVYPVELQNKARAAMSDPGDPQAKAAYNAINAQLKGSTKEEDVVKVAQAVVGSQVPAEKGGPMTGEQVKAACDGYAAWVKAGSPAASKPADAVISLVQSVSDAGLAYKGGLLYDGGLKEYDYGLLTYYFNKGTLANAEKKLAAAKEQLDAAKLQLDEAEKTIKDGEAKLAEGKASLKAYEDGMAQVKAGLKQVMETEPSAGLVSIADRLGAGFTYMDGDELNIDKGFQVVDAAKEYSAENGALVTKEIASRIIGAVLVLVAGALAAIAGVIGLIKSGKISGLLSIVSVAAVIIGVALSYLAGSELSKIAGSEGSMLMYIAGGILAVAGLVYGIVSMAGKKTEEVKAA